MNEGRSADGFERHLVSREPVDNAQGLRRLGEEIEGRAASATGARRLRGRSGGVDGNSRLTSSIAAIVFVLLAAEGVTILRVGSLLDAHVFIGVVLIPVALVKIGSTTWRFMRYYTGDPEYRRKGPPALVLRLLGPLVVVLTIVVLLSGVGLVLLPTSLRQQLFFVHRASFVLWLGVMTIHVLGHLGETVRLAPRDWLERTRRQVAGASSRQWILVSSVVVGVLGGALVMPYAYGWFAQ